MTLLTRILAAAVIASTIGVNALTVSPSGDRLARHNRHAQHERAPIPAPIEEQEDIVEKRVDDSADELEERGVSKKVGLAWAGNPDSNIAKFVSSTTKYIYTWSPWCPAEAKKLGLECCPMLWGTKQISTFQQQKYKGGKCIMGMNEVNVPSQGFLSVAEGIKLWNQYIRPMKAQGYTTISPSVTAGADGVNWLKNFYKQCGGPASEKCGADVLAFHYYGMDSNDFISYAQKFHAITGGTVWVTEMACQNFGDKKKGQCTQDMVFSFMDKTTAWMKNTPWIGAYFFFGLFQDMYNVNPNNRMVNGAGAPNSLGHHYVGHY